jgi:hypothetical protein
MLKLVMLIKMTVHKIFNLSSPPFQRRGLEHRASLHVRQLLYQGELHPGPNPVFLKPI